MSQTKAALIADIKKLMRHLKTKEYTITDHYEMIVIEKGKLSYLRYPDSQWTETEIPMRELRYCRDQLIDLVD